MYREEDFNRWMGTFRIIQQYINILLVLGFTEDFNKLGNTEKEHIIEETIEDVDYIERLSETLGMR